MSAFEYAWLNSTVITSARPVSSVYRGARRAATRNAAGTASASNPSWAFAKVASLPSLSGRSANGSLSEPRNCSARAMYQKPSHVAGRA